MTKVCVRCRQAKFSCDFYDRDKKCKECRKEIVRSHRAANLDKIRAYDRNRGLTPERKKRVRDQYKKRISNPNNRAKEWARQAEWRERNKAKRAAHLLIQYAIRRGDRTRMPCERCGDSKSDAHHEDYTKPLDVIWLCKKCHGERHREINEEKRR